MTSCGEERWGMYHRVVNCLLHWKEEKKEDGDFRLSPSVGTWFTGLQQSWCAVVVVWHRYHRKHWWVASKKKTWREICLTHQGFLLIHHEYQFLYIGPFTILGLGLDPFVSVLIQDFMEMKRTPKAWMVLKHKLACILVFVFYLFLYDV